MSPDSISDFLETNFEGLAPIDSCGEKSFFYNPGGVAPRGTYFCTLKEKNGENDQASGLDREGVFRLNFGIAKSSFLKLFLAIPKRPLKGGVISGEYDFKELGKLTPHPVYGWMCWVSILNPSKDSFEKLKELLIESYQLVKQKHEKKLSAK